MHTALLFRVTVSLVTRTWAVIYRNFCCISVSEVLVAV